MFLSYCLQSASILSLQLWVETKNIGCIDNNKQQKYDVILANLNCSPPQAIKTIALFSSLLKENGGVFVLLLKLPAAVKQESANNFYHRLLIEEGIYQVDDVFLFTNKASHLAPSCPKCLGHSSVFESGGFSRYYMSFWPKCKCKKHARRHN